MTPKCRICKVEMMGDEAKWSGDSQVCSLDCQNEADDQAKVLALSVEMANEAKKGELLQKAHDLMVKGLDWKGTPPSADQTAAIRKVREAVFTANSARACKGK